MITKEEISRNAYGYANKKEKITCAIEMAILFPAIVAISTVLFLLPPTIGGTYNIQGFSLFYCSIPLAFGALAGAFFGFHGISFFSKKYFRASFESIEKYLEMRIENLRNSVLDDITSVEEALKDKANGIEELKKEMDEVAEEYDRDIAETTTEKEQKEAQIKEYKSLIKEYKAFLS